MLIFYVGTLCFLSINISLLSINIGINTENKNNQDFKRLHEKIDTKSRLSSRVSLRATCPKYLMKQLREKLPEFTLPFSIETPLRQYPEVEVSMTDIFRVAKAADDFAEEIEGCERP